MRILPAGREGRLGNLLLVLIIINNDPDRRAVLLMTIRFHIPIKE